jgi:gamma-glutamylcyclotransferase (GGCT)/AIG2-like uncharacterized protein YtfP
MSTHLLFVYGTLKPGRQRWPLLEPFVDPQQAPVEDAVEGQLWDTPYGWPAVTLDRAGSVHGVVVALDPASLAAALDSLDRVEGIDVGLFRRQLVTTTSSRTCWIYDWPGDTAGFSPLQRPW